MVRLDELSSQRAAEMVQELKHVAPPTNDEAIMWLLHAIWLRFADEAHRDLFSDLDGSYADSILNRMKEHYSRLRNLYMYPLRGEWSFKRKKWVGWMPKSECWRRALPKHVHKQRPPLNGGRIL